MKTTITIFNKNEIIVTAITFGNPITLIECLSNMIDDPLTQEMYVETSDDIELLIEGCEYRIGCGFEDEWTAEVVDNWSLTGYDFGTKKEAVAWVTQAISRTLEGSKTRQVCEIV